VTDREEDAAMVEAAMHHSEPLPTPLTPEEKERLRVECRRTGAELFEKLKAWWLLHWLFDEPMHLAMTCLFNLQSRCYRLLPSVFYLKVAGKRGSGKSKFLKSLAKLGRGLSLGDITTASMVRELGRGRELKNLQGQRVGQSSIAVLYHTACVDELDKLPKDARAECEGVLRNGYDRDGTMYMRCVGERLVVQAWDLYMPKAFAITSSMESALASRSLSVHAVERKGEDAYEVMMNNRWVHGVEELVQALDDWADLVNQAWSWEDIEALERSPEHTATVAQVLDLGASRAAEHMTTAVTICMLAGINLVEVLKHSVEELELANEEDEEEIAALNKALLDAALKQQHIETTIVVRVKQSAIKKAMNDARRAAGERQLGTQRFAEIRRAAGIKDSWLAPAGNALVWNVPTVHLNLLLGLATTPTAPINSDHLGQQSLDGRCSRGGRSEGEPDDGLFDKQVIPLIQRDRESGTRVEELVRRYGSDACIAAGITTTGARV